MDDNEVKVSVADIAGLEKLPGWTVILSAASRFLGPRPYEKVEGSWLQPGSEEEFTSAEIPLPAAVLHTP
jgi:hypothetical protein